MNEKELIDQLQKLSENIPADNSWKQAAKAGLLKDLPNIPQDMKPPKDIARSMTRINPLSIAASTVAIGALVLGAIFVSKSLNNQDPSPETPVDSQKTEVITQEPIEEIVTIVETPSEVPECIGANPRRIDSIGSEVRVINALIPLRSSPDAQADNVIATLPEGSMLEIIGEPVCVPFLEGANLWWFVRTEEGMEGYAAEGSAISDTYYLEEIK